MQFSARAARGSLKPVDQFHKVDKIPEPGAGESAEGTEAEMKARAADAEHEENVKLVDAYWSAKAKEKDWDCVKADLSVYRYSGKGVPEQDPRCTEEYRKRFWMDWDLAKARPGLA